LLKSRGKISEFQHAKEEAFNFSSSKNSMIGVDNILNPRWSDEVKEGERSSPPQTFGAIKSVDYQKIQMICRPEESETGEEA